MRPINEIIVHCSATRAKWMENETLWAKRQEIKRWHVQDRGWRDIGYHFLIDRDGTTTAGRPVSQTGAHVRGHNTGTIGVCLMGGHGSSERDEFLDNFTPEQDAALRKMIADLRDKYPKINKVSGHNEYAAKACPGFSVPLWYKSEPVRTAEAISQPDPAEQPSGPLGAIFAALAAFFVRGTK